ncbi:hypothetical protein CFBP3840_05314 [Pseudomonas syringae]|uniref:DUF4411 family protein n=1 Tax=Pseudomonas syringae TaxID=317 RepID=A0A2K4X2F4_PSESX|nr:hypothetical protein CFBP3840_05314 [Pseudomonas syringae]
MFLMDSNTLIEAKNRYYGMTICPAYWQWLLLQNQTFFLASIGPVKDELTKAMMSWLTGQKIIRLFSKAFRMKRLRPNS